MTHVPKIREHRLKNGMLVLAIERRANPIVTAMIWYRVGSRDERTGETGLSHFLEHMMFKGTKRLAKGEVDLITARLGGSNNAFTDHDYTAYYFNFASDRWEAAFAMEAERMRGCLLDEAEFQSEKKVVIEELRMGQDDPWRDLHEAMGPVAYQVHGYRHPVIGWKEDLERLGRDAMVAYYRRHYAPDRAVVVVAGDAGADEVFAAAERHFGALPAGAAPRETPLAEPVQRGERRVRIERDTNISRLLVAYRGVTCGVDDDYALDVLCAALSSGRASRLYQSMVKGTRVATHVSVENEARFDPGVVWVSVEARDGVGAEAVERVLFDELERVRAKPLSAREIARSKKLIIASQAISMESAHDLADRVGRSEILCSWKYVPGYLKAIEAVTAERIQAAAERILAPASRTVGWSVPAAPREKKHSKSGARFGAATRRSGRRLMMEKPATAGKFPLPPRRGVLPAVKLSFVREVLGNGLVVMATRNATAPTVSMMARVDLNSMFESDAQAGLESFTGALLDEGTRRWSGDEIAQSIEEAGGFFSSGSGGVSCSVLAESFPLSLDIAASVLIEPTFPESAVRRVRDEILSDLLADEDDLRTRAYRLLRAAVYGAHPLHRQPEGSVATVRRLTRADAVAFHKRWYSPGRTMIAISGDVDPRETIARVKRVFGRWSNNLHSMPEPAEIPAPRARELSETLAREQVHIVVGHAGIRRTDPRYISALVMDHVLGSGSGFTDRISKKLRDEEGLAYAVRASVTSTAGREPGMFSAFMSTEPRNARHATAGLLREVRRIIDEPPTADEVRLAKDYLIGSYPFAVERNSGRAQTLIQMERYQLGADYLERFPSLVEAVTPDDVARTAREILHPDRCVVVRVGPETKPAREARASRAGR